MGVAPDPAGACHCGVGARGYGAAPPGALTLRSVIGCSMPRNSRPWSGRCASADLAFRAWLRSSTPLVAMERALWGRCPQHGLTGPSGASYGIRSASQPAQAPPADCSTRTWDPVWQAAT